MKKLFNIFCFTVSRTVDIFRYYLMIAGLSILSFYWASSSEAIFSEKVFNYLQNNGILISIGIVTLYFIAKDLYTLIKHKSAVFLINILCAIIACTIIVVATYSHILSIPLVLITYVSNIFLKIVLKPIVNGQKNVWNMAKTIAKNKKDKTNDESTNA